MFFMDGCICQIMGLSKVINQRVGLGAFQIQSFLILCLIDMNDGVELVLSSFLNPVIKSIFPSVTSSFIQLMASIFYVGVLVGSISSGVLADQFGRKKLITCGSVLQMTVSLLFYCANNLQMMLVLRFLYGFSFGFTVAVTTSMFAEISPAEYRGKGILLINFCISIGKLYAVFLGYVFLEKDIAKTNWKLMMVCGSLPNIVVFLGSLYVLEESPRFLLMHEQYDKGLFVVQKMLTKNGKNALTYQEEVEIREEFRASAVQSQERIDYHSFWILLHDRYIKKAIALTLCWMVINFCFYGQLVIQAFHLQTKTSTLDLSKYFFTVFGQIPSLLVSFYLIDHPDFGRKKSLIYFFLGAALSHFIFAGTQLTLIGSIARFFMKDVFQILYPLTTESFDTRLRTKGFGFCSGMGRVGSIVMPFVTIPMDQWKRGSVYILFGFFSLLAAGVSSVMVEQTRQKKLDEAEVDSPRELHEILSP